MRRVLLSICALACLPTPAKSEAAPPDFRGQLRSDLAIEAWFDAERTRGFMRVGEHTSRIYRAWKVALADLDADGTREILLGIWSDQPRHDEPRPHRTVWVLRWDEAEGRLEEAWRGSALARPLVDFETHGAQLVARERVGDTCFQTTYSWTGFGFRGVHTIPRTCEE